MAEYKNDELEASFTLPDSVTIRQELAYDSAVALEGRGVSSYERLWKGLQVIAENWQCPHVQLTDSLERVEGRKALEVIKWAGLLGYSHMLALRETPKN